MKSERDSRDPFKALCVAVLKQAIKDAGDERLSDKARAEALAFAKEVTGFDTGYIQRLSARLRGVGRRGHRNGNKS